MAGGVAESPVGSLTEEILVPNTFAKVVTNTGGKGISRSVSSYGNAKLRNKFPEGK